MPLLSLFCPKSTGIDSGQKWWLIRRKLWRKLSSATFYSVCLVFSYLDISASLMLFNRAFEIPPCMAEILIDAGHTIGYEYR
jgi:hypothetical protein